MEITIIGGGVIGLSVAYALSEDGHAITLLERGQTGREASWAGAGILAPPADSPGSDPLARLLDTSVRLHAAWAASLRNETGIETGHRACGGLDVALNRAEALALESLVPSWTRSGIDFRLLSGSEARQDEPALGDSVCAAASFPRRAQLRNPWHLKALRAACVKRGVLIHENTEVDDFRIRDGRVTHLHDPGRWQPCETLILAAGPWTEQLAARLGASIPTKPIRGQILLLHEPNPSLARILEHGRDYLVPRGDGRVLVGSTEEDVGFDPRTTEFALARLKDFACRLVPVLRHAKVESAWAGLRPGSPDEKPTIGRIPGLANAYVATGHFRAGIQLSTGTARLLADLLAGRISDADLAPFAPTGSP
jgi:glycine oxidase